MIGRQTVDPRLQEEFGASTVKQLFKNLGFQTVYDLDLHNDEADLLMDLNSEYVITRQLWPRPDLVFDIGTLEHVADSHRALENMLSAVKRGGLLFLLTPVKGYFNHGLHTFSPEYVLETLKQNGYEVLRRWWLSKDGPHCSDSAEDPPCLWSDVCIVVLARNIGFSRPMKTIQQRCWLRKEQAT